MSCRWIPSCRGWSIMVTAAPPRCASPANTRFAAASSICFRRGSSSPCGSIFSATRSNRSAVSTPRPSARCSTCARLTSFRSRNFNSSPRPSAGSGWAMSRRSARPSGTIRSTRPSARAAAIPAWSIGCRCSGKGWIRCSIISATRRSRSSRKARTPRASASSRSRIITRRGARRWSIPAAARSTSRCRRIGSI